jgi:hypothetical protein
VRPFSHVEDTASLLRRDLNSQTVALNYNPGLPPGLYKADQGVYINTYRPGFIQPEQGDVTRFLDFIKHLIPAEADRTHMLRWMATLLACPDIKMTIAILLISENQGVGKSTIGEKILMPLLGEHNVSVPSASLIVDGQFNEWVVQKRLAVVHEIYEGHNSKAYNKLKEAVSERKINVHLKYQPSYTMDNWCHALASSNSMKALKLTETDRRWFVPGVTEEKREFEYWRALNDWLKLGGGLPAIAYWAQTFVAEHGHVLEGEEAPNSAAKAAMIKENYSPGMNLVEVVLENIKAAVEDKQRPVGEQELAPSLHLPPDCFLLDTDLVRLVKAEIYNGQNNPMLERRETLRRVAKSAGWRVGEYRATVPDWDNVKGSGDSRNARIISLDPTVANMLPKDVKEAQKQKVEALENYVKH